MSTGAHVLNLSPAPSVVQSFRLCLTQSHTPISFILGESRQNQRAASRPSRLAQAGRTGFAAGSPSQRARAGHGLVLAEAARVFRPRFSRGRRLHGSRQLGHRPRRRRAIRLHAAVRHHDFQPHGDSAPASVHQTRRRHRTRPRPGLPRSLFQRPPSGFSGSFAKSPLPRAIWPKSSARPSRCNCSSAFRWSGAASSRRVDVLAVLYLQNKGFRYIEALVITLIATIGGCFAAELFLSKPGIVGPMLLRFRSQPGNSAKIRICFMSASASSARRSCRIICTCTRPSSRRANTSRPPTANARPSSSRRLIRPSRSCSRCSSTARFSFSRRPRFTGPAIRTWRKSRTPTNYCPLLGVGGASILFAVALLASGQNSTLTGTLAGQIVMEGFHQHPAAPVAAPLDHAAALPSFRPFASSVILAKAKPRNCSSPVRSCFPCNSASPSGR